MLRFELTEDGTGCLLAKQDLSLTEADIPEVYCGKPVVAVGDEAFRDCVHLTKITLPSSIRSIGNDAFWGCSGLVFFDTGDGVISVGDYAFWGCTALSDVRVGDSVRSFGTQAFYNCASLCFIRFPESVVKLGSSLFGDCKQMHRVYYTGKKLPKSWGNAWMQDATVTAIPCYDKLKFKKNEDGKSYSVVGDRECVGAQASMYADAENVVIPSLYKGLPVTKIAYDAFSGAASLRSVFLSNGIASIGSCAFGRCSELIDITIPNSVLGIGYDAFRGCSSLARITVPSSIQSMGYRTFADCAALTSITFRGKKAEWKAISEDPFNGKSLLDDHTGAYTVYCTDGAIPKS